MSFKQVHVSQFISTLNRGGLTVEDEVEFLLTLSRRREKHTIADRLLYPVNEAVHLPLDRQVLLSVRGTDGRFPAQDAHGASSLTAD